MSLTESFHINRLEMRAVRLALMHYAAQFQGLSLLFRIDNLSTVYYLNKQGDAFASAHG